MSLCVCLACREIVDNNLIFGLWCRTSALYGRCVRLSILYLGILTNVTICALFFEISPPPGQEADSVFFWESLAENIWVSFYSVLFSLPPLLIVIWAFKVPMEPIKVFSEELSPVVLPPLYAQFRSRLRCHVRLGFAIFFFFAACFTLFLLGFGHVASNRVL